MTVSITIDEAAVRLRRAERVLVIGCSGSGKSTLARRLSGTLGLRHVPMDREIFWMPGWRMRPDMADGCPERISLEFLRYIWNFERTESPEIEARLGEHATVPVVVLRSRPEADRLAMAVEAVTSAGDAPVFTDRDVACSALAPRRTPSSH